jgi:hypothetical protein
MSDEFHIEVGGKKLEAEECQYLTGVLRHLKDLRQKTPTNDPLWGYFDAAADAVGDLLDMMRP